MSTLTLTLMMEHNSAKYNFFNGCRGFFLFIFCSTVVSFLSSHFQYFRNRKYNPTVLLQDIMTRLFAPQLAERKQVHDAEMAELSK